MVRIFESNRRRGRSHLFSHRKVSHSHWRQAQFEVLEQRCLLSGTPELVLDINAVSDPTLQSNPTALYAIGNSVVFKATDKLHGTELWKSNGTPEGTSILKDITPGPNSFAIDEPWAPVNGNLFFPAVDPALGRELWVSDGTDEGTHVLIDIYTGTNPSTGEANGSSPFHLTNVNGTLFFTAFDPIHGTELWKSDGTAAGTVFVKDIRSGTLGSSGSDDLFVNVNGTLFFTANDGVTGTELWKSDGTADGTMLVKDLTCADHDRIRRLHAASFDLRVGRAAFQHGHFFE